MTRAEANDILTMQKLGLGRFGKATINAALVATGDLAVMTRLNPMEQAPQKKTEVPGQIRVWRSSLAAGNSGVHA